MESTLEKFICDDCGSSFSRKHDIKRHFKSSHCSIGKLKANHEVKAKRKTAGKHSYLTLEFNNLNEFLQWKNEEEQFSCSKFSKNTRSWKTKNGKKTKYICHRSGYVRIKKPSERQRLLKRKGSCKINNHCTAYMLCEETIDGRIKVTYNRTHCNHDLEMKHLPLSSFEEQKLAKKLEEGLSLEYILDDIRTSLKDSNPNSLTRTQLITRKDLHNIKAKFNISYKERPSSLEATSVSGVRALLDAYKKSELSPFLYYKEKGMKDEIFERDDVLLVIMDEAQIDLMKKYGKDEICIDCTYCKTYDFYLTTILVVDNVDMGVPVAYLICNKEDTNFIMKFFEVVKDACGVIRTDAFMSDDVPTLFAAWVDVMGPCNHQLLCTWHVDRDWRKNLSLIKNANVSVAVTKLKKSVLKGLRTIMEETKECMFPGIVNAMVQKLEKDPATRDFAEYFKNNYATRYEMWAYAFRKHIGIDLDLKIEALHNELKKVRVNVPANEELEYLVVTLLRINRNKMFKRMSALLLETDTHMLKKIRRRHKEAMLIPREDVTVISDQLGVVTSQTDRSTCYSVTKSKDECDCKLRCYLCDSICVHQYTCTCVDNTITRDFCKHIHAFLKLLRNSEEYPVSIEVLPDVHSNDSDEEIHDALDHERLQSIDDSQREDNTAQSIKSLIQQLAQYAESSCKDDEIDEEILRCLKQAEHLMKTKKEKTLLEKKLNSPLKKRKKRTTKSPIKKPIFSQEVEVNIITDDNEEANNDMNNELHQVIVCDWNVI